MYTLKTDCIDLWRIDLDRCDASSAWKTLSPDEVEQSRRYVHTLHGERYAIGRAFLRETLVQYLNARPSELRFRYSSFGKPELDGPFAGALYFNVSHCENEFVAIIASVDQIGVDIERIRPLSDERELAERFFAPREYAQYASLPRELQTRGFFNAWTRKEAFLKARGTGLQTPLDAFEVSLDPRQPCRIERFRSLPEGRDEWQLMNVRDENNHALAIAAKHPLRHPLTLRSMTRDAASLAETTSIEA